MRKWLFRGCLLMLVLITTGQYAWIWLEPGALSDTTALLLGQQDKPFVYRMQVPFLARLLWLAGLPANLALAFVIGLSAIGFLYGLYALLCEVSSTGRDPVSGRGDGR